MNKRAILDLVAGAVLLMFLGILYVWSKFVVPVSEFLAWDIESVKLTANFMLCCFVVGILIGGLLSNKVKPKYIALAGGILLAGGIFAASFTPPSAPWLIYITYGICGGTGVGLAYNTVLSCAQKWFPTKRSLAVGVSVFFFGFATVIFAPLIVSLTNRLGVVNSFRLLAAIIAAATIALHWMISVPDAEESSAVQKTESKSSAINAAGEDFTLPQALKTKNFYLIFVFMVFGNSVYLLANPSFQTMAENRGIGDLGTVMLMISGIANSLGRISIPVIITKLGSQKSAIITSTVTAVCGILLCFVQGVALIPVIAIIAFFFGGYSAIAPVITSDYFGLKNVGAVFGAVMCGYMLSALIFPIILSGAGDVTKFLTVGIAAALSVVLLLLLKKNKPAVTV
jgi:OFA family oxalate/formate antiporter-like MFS transporter